MIISYDEWICVMKGEIVFEHADGSLPVRAGQTVFIAAGERFRPTFPEDSEYIPGMLI